MGKINISFKEVPVMNYFHWGARMICKSSPALLLLGGAALACCSQPVRRGLHRMAVQATKGILIVNDEVKNLASKTSATRTCTKCHGRRLAVAAVGGVLTVKEKAGAVCNQFSTIVEEARVNHELSRHITQDTSSNDQFYDEVNDLDRPNQVVKKRIVAQKIVE